jgi:hypothetical protein
MVAPVDGRNEVLWILIGFFFLAGILCAFVLAQACVSMLALTTMESQLSARVDETVACWKVLIILLKIILSPVARFFGIPLE